MVTQNLLIVSAAVKLLLLARLRQLRLGMRPFVALAAMIITEVLLYFVLMVPEYRSHRYTVWWEFTLPIALLADSLAGISTYRAIAELYPRIGRFAVWLYASSLLVVAIVCLLGLPYETRRIGGSEATLRTLFLLDRCTHTLLAGGLVVAVAFLSRFPKPLKLMPRNLGLHTRLLCAYFSTDVLLRFISNLMPLRYAHSIGDIEVFCEIALYISWIFGLSKDGQKTEPWPQLSPETLTAIDEQNQAAVDLAKKAAREAMN